MLTNARRSLLVGLCVGAFAVPLTPAVAVRPTPPVIEGPANQDGPFSNGTYVAWTQNSLRKLNNYDAYVRPVAGGPKRRINEAGDGFPGNFVPGTDTLIYQQKWRESLRRHSDLWLYDAATRVRAALPAKINTTKWEFRGRISSSYIMFLRASRQPLRLYLYDRTTGSLELLLQPGSPRTDLFSNFVGEGYATWTRCNARACSAWLHDLSSGATRKLPTEGRRSQYGLTIDEASGTAYWVRSGRGCGVGVRILRAPLGDLTATTKVYAFPRGIDTDFTTSLAPNLDSGGLDLWIQRWNCQQEAGDIWVIRDVDQGSPRRQPVAATRP